MVLPVAIVSSMALTPEFLWGIQGFLSEQRRFNAGGESVHGVPIIGDVKLLV